MKLGLSAYIEAMADIPKIAKIIKMRISATLSATTVAKGTPNVVFSDFFKYKTLKKSPILPGVIKPTEKPTNHADTHLDRG